MPKGTIGRSSQRDINGANGTEKRTTTAAASTRRLQHFHFVRIKLRQKGARPRPKAAAAGQGHALIYSTHKRQFCRCWCLFVSLRLQHGTRATLCKNNATALAAAVKGATRSCWQLILSNWSRAKSTGAECADAWESIAFGPVRCLSHLLLPACLLASSLPKSFVSHGFYSSFSLFLPLSLCIFFGILHYAMHYF